MDLPKELRYTKSHEWVRLEEDDLAVVGITDFAQSQLSDLTYVELPAVDDVIAAGDETAVVESVKAASDVYAPLSGLVVAVNEELSAHPETINSDPYGEGWLYKIKLESPSDVDTLLDADAYEELIPGDD